MTKWVVIGLTFGLGTSTRFAGSEMEADDIVSEFLDQGVKCYKCKVIEEVDLEEYNEDVLT